MHTEMFPSPDAFAVMAAADAQKARHSLSRSGYYRLVLQPSLRGDTVRYVVEVVNLGHGDGIDYSTATPALVDASGRRLDLIAVSETKWETDEIGHALLEPIDLHWK